MFGWLRKKSELGPWRPIATAPVNVVLILAVRARSTIGAGGSPIHYAPTARIGWKDPGGVWIDFTTGANLDVEPALFMELPALDAALPPLIPTRRKGGRRRWAPSDPLGD